MSGAVAFWRLLLTIAIIGTASSTVFLAIALIAALRNLMRGRSQARAVASVATSALPPVTIFKPLHEAEPRLEENLASFLTQDYPDYEVVFGCRSLDDPALDVVERLRLRYPHIPMRVAISGAPLWPNAKVWSLAKMLEGCRRDYFVVSDSDIHVGPNFLRNAIAPLLDPAVGLVTCLYQGVPAPGFWSRLEALGMSVEFASGVITADMLAGMTFALGSAMAVRRDALEKIGGIGTTANYYADDFVLGNRVAAAEYRVILSPYRVAHVLCAQTLRQTFQTQVRWMKSTRYSRPKGHLGTGLTFAVPFGLLGWIAASALGHPVFGLGLLGIALANRIVQSVVIGYGLIGDRRALSFCWLYPLRDLLGFFLWAASYFGGSGFVWRGERYRFNPGGEISPLARSKKAAAQ